MNESAGYDSYGGQQPPIVGYDEWGRPVYAPQPSPYGTQQGYDPAGGYTEPGHPGYDTQAGHPGPGYDPSGYPAPGYDTYGTGPAHGPAHGPAQGQGQGQGQVQGYPPQAEPPQPQPWAADPARTGQIPGPRQPAPPAPQGAPQPAPSERDYHTAQFEFVQEEDEESEDVIDWLKFTESRTERREEAKRRGRSRKRFLAVVLVLVLLANGGFLWFTDRLPGLDGPGEQDAGAAATKRDVIAVHLQDVDTDATSTALLVDDAGAGSATTLLLPGELAVPSGEGDSTTLSASVEDEGPDATRDALGRLLGTDIAGSWRLDTPFLETLTDLVGGITLDADATVPAPKKGEDPLVTEGKGQDLDGAEAIAYATYRADGEPESAQLERFGQVMAAVLEKTPRERDAATTIVESLGQIMEPPLTEKDLGATLATLAGRTKAGEHRTELLPVEKDGTLSERTADGTVKDVLGGTVEAADPAGGPRVAVRDASGSDGAAEAARVALVNGGFTLVGGSGTQDGAERSLVAYAEEADAGQAKEIASTLGLPAAAVRQADGAPGADITVTLGADYEPGS